MTRKKIKRKTQIKTPNKGILPIESKKTPKKVGSKRRPLTMSVFQTVKKVTCF